jgi:LuxR family maltose regulon positive regulatory protein
VLLARDLPDQALALLQRLRALAADQGRTGSVIEIQALQAGTTRRRWTPWPKRSPSRLPKGMCGSSPAKAARCAPCSAGWSPPSGKRTPRPVPLDYLARLLPAFEEKHAEAGRAAAAVRAGLVEPLTAREVEVLGLLAAGKSNPRIAEELVVTLT